MICKIAMCQWFCATEVLARTQYFGSHAGYYHPLLGINLFNATKRSSIIRLNRIPSNGLHTVFQAINELQHPNLLILLPSKGRHKTCKNNAAGLQEACQLYNIQGKLAGTLAQKKGNPPLSIAGLEPNWLYIHFLQGIDNKYNDTSKLNNVNLTIPWHSFYLQLIAHHLNYLLESQNRIK